MLLDLINFEHKDGIFHLILLNSRCNYNFINFQNAIREGQKRTPDNALDNLWIAMKIGAKDEWFLTINRCLSAKNRLKPS